MSKPWWYDEKGNVPWSRKRKSFVETQGMVQCERCLFYVHGLEEHKEVCDKMSKKELKELLKND